MGHTGPGLALLIYRPVDARRGETKEKAAARALVDGADLGDEPEAQERTSAAS